MAQPQFQVGRSFIPEEPFRTQEVSGAEGRAIGAAISDAGQHLQVFAEIYRKDVEQLDRFQSLKILDEAKTNAEIRLQEMSKTMQPGARDFAKQYKEERDKILGQARTQIPAYLQAEFDYKFATLDNDLRQRAFLIEQKEREAYYKDNLNESLNGFLIRIDEAPNAIGDIRQEGQELIEASGLSTAQKADIIRQWKANTSIAYFQTLIRDDPERAALALGGQVRLTNPEKIVVASKIRSAAKEAGIDPDLAVAVAYLESSLVPDKSNGVPGDTIEGLFQQDLDSRTRHGYEPGLDGNIRGGLGDMKERISQFRKDFGRAPTPAEYYIYHYQGLKGGKAILKADPSTPLEEVLIDVGGESYADKVFKGNAWLKGMTVADFKLFVARKMNNALAVTGGNYDVGLDTADPFVADIPWDKRAVLRDKAEAEFRQQESIDYTISTRLQERVEEQTYKEAVDLYADNKLTTKWVEDNVRNLSATQYKSLMSLALKEDTTKKSDFDTYFDLLQRVDDPLQSEAVIKDAAEAVGKGLLTQRDFDKIYGLARREQEKTSGETERRGYAMDLERYIDNMLKPQGVGIILTPEMVSEAERAKLDFIEWRIRNPNVPLSDLRKYADEVIENVKRDRMRKPAIAAVLRAMKVNSVNEIQPGQLEKFAAELIKRRGTLKEFEYKRLLFGINEIELLLTEVTKNGK